MKNTGVFLKVILTAVLCLGGDAWAYSGGDGLSEATAYLIANAADLTELGTTPTDISGNFYFRQTENIDLSGFTGTQFHRIGYYECAFRGTYDGNGFAISHFTYENSTGDYIGFFGSVLGGTSSTIKNVRLVNVRVAGHNNVGALIGSGNCMVRNCSVNGGTITGNENVGGLLGYAFNSVSDCTVNAAVSGSRYVGGITSYFSAKDNAIDRCRVQGTVSGGNGSMADVGGIVGRLYKGYVRHGSSSAVITATGYYAGGIVGSTFTNVRIENCSSSGNVSSTSSDVGGVVGSLDFAGMTSCRSSGTVQGLDEVGGIAGFVNGSSSQLNDCFASGDISGRKNIGGAFGMVVANSGFVNLYRCGADGFYVTTQGVYGGGLVGQIQGNNPGNITISECFAYPEIICNGIENFDRRYQAGLVGSALRAAFTNCSAWGSVYNGFQWTGGLVGSATGCTVNNCYSVGKPSGLGDVGGLIGKESGCTVTNSFWDKWTSSQTVSAGGIGLTTADMQTRLTYTAATWDFTNETTNGTNDIWRMCTEGTAYPKLAWWFVQNGDFTCPDVAAMEDFAYLAARWMRNDCAAENNCEGADLNRSGDIEINDLMTFAANWMEEI